MRAWRHAHLLLPLAAAALALWHTSELFGAVLNKAGDDTHHLMAEWALMGALDVGDNIFGPLAFDFGLPLLRYYQCLYYLVNIAVASITGLDLILVHNATIIVSLALSPFASYYMLRKIGLDRFAAAAGSFAAMTSVAAFGNSIEAYHYTGIVTQSLGGVFFPLFLGSFAGMLRGENRPATTALLFALAFLSHALMAVFAVLAGALYLAVTRVPLRPNLTRLTAFALLSAALVSFWTLPFLEHTLSSRPVPDSIVRFKDRAFWFNSVSKDELVRLTTSGRLFDDPRSVAKDRDDALDDLMDTMSILPAKRTRPPVLTLLVALGALVAVARFRRPPERFLLAGLALGLAFFAGPDDFRWLRFLPFTSALQPFRATFLPELFAFGLVGVGAAAAIERLVRLAAGRPAALGYPLTALAAIIAAGGVLWGAQEILASGETHLTVRKHKRWDAAVDALEGLPRKGYPYRVKAAFHRSYKFYQDWYVKHGFQTYATHWAGVGPTSAFHLAWYMGDPERNSDLYALAGVRYFAGKTEALERVIDARDQAGEPLFQRLENGRGSRGKKNSWFSIVDTGRDHFVRPLPGAPVPVVCNDAQWLWVAWSWLERFGARASAPDVPVPFRVAAGELVASGLLEHAPAVLYLGRVTRPADLEALQAFVEGGGALISPRPVAGLAVVIPPPDQPFWRSLPEGPGAPAARATPGSPRDAEGAAFADVEAERVKVRRRTLQRFTFDLRLPSARPVLLPMIAQPGWHASLDGEPTGVFPAGPDLVGVHVPAGKHRLVYYWEMPGWHVGCLAASLAALLVTLLSLLPRRLLRRARGMFR